MPVAFVGADLDDGRPVWWAARAGTVHHMGTLLLILALVVAAAIAIALLKLVAGVVVAIVLALVALFLWKRYAPRTT